MKLSAPTVAPVGAVAVLVPAVVLAVPALGRRLIAPLIMRLVARALPRLGVTERTAVEAGTVWWDGELCAGKPDWAKLLAFQVRELSEKERAFLDGPVEELCAMLDEWRNEQIRDLPPEVWRFLQGKGFFGMIIPEQYGAPAFPAPPPSPPVTHIPHPRLTAA